MGFFKDLSSDMLSKAKKTAAESGVDVVTLANTEQGGVDVQKRDLGNGVNAYLDENGQISSFSRVDPARPGMIQLYGPNGESRGEEKITTTTQDLIKNLGPIALAAGGTALAQGLLGPAAGAGGAAGTAGMTAAELAQLDLALGGAGGTAGAETLANALATGATVPTLTNLTGGSGVLTGAAAGITAESVAAKLAADAAASGNLNALAAGAGGAAAGAAGGAGAGAGAGAAGAGAAGAGAGAASAAGAGAGSTLTSLLTPAAIAASGLVGASAAKSAAETQAESAREANALLYKMYQEQKGLQEPFRGAGITAQNRLLDLLGLSQNKGAEGYGRYAKDFGMSDFTADPGYAFRLAEGQKALERNAAARGGLISGGALKAATRYGQDMGSQEYQSAFNRYQTNRANQLAPLGSLLSTGQAAASNQSAAAGNYGTQAAQGLTNIGAANATGTMASANALGDALGQYLRYSSNQMNASSSQNLADAIRKSTYGPA